MTPQRTSADAKVHPLCPRAHPLSGSWNQEQSSLGHQQMAAQSPRAAGPESGSVRSVTPQGRVFARSTAGGDPNSVTLEEMCWLGVTMSALGLTTRPFPTPRFQPLTCRVCVHNPSQSTSLSPPCACRPQIAFREAQNALSGPEDGSPSKLPPFMPGSTAAGPAVQLLFSLSLLTPFLS